VSNSAEQKRAQKRAARSRKSKSKKKVDLKTRLDDLKRGRESYSRFYSTYDGGER
jgi:hypothetical protein